MVSAKKKKIITWVSIIIIVLTVGQLIFVSFLENSVTEVKEERSVQAKAEVGRPAGILLDDQNLDFGRIPPGQHAIKEFYLANVYDEDLLVVVEAKGNITQYLSAIPNDFVLPAGEKTTIQMIFNAENASEGNYTGEVRIRMYSHVSFK